MDFLLLTVFITVFILLFAFSAFFSASETAMLSLSPLQIQKINEQSPQLGAHLSRMLKRPEIMLSTLLIGNTFVNAALASVGLSFIVMSGWVPEPYTEIVSVLVVTILVLLFGEISPKQFAIRHTETLIPHIVRVLRVAIPLLYPLSWCLQKLLYPIRHTLRPERRAVSDEEIVSVVNLGEEHHAIDEAEGAMVRGIFRLSELKASDVMTPRVDLTGLDINDPPEKHLNQMMHATFVWMPLWDDSADNFIDFVDVPKFLLDPKHDLKAARCNYTLAVPENVSLDDLLITLYRQNLPMVLVTDEYGGTAGIVSRGDILELLALEVSDRPSANENTEIRKCRENCWIISGDAALEQINFMLGTHLEADDADRMSGWVMFHSGRIPRVGETITADGYRVTIQKMRMRKILSVFLEDLEPESRETDVPQNLHSPQIQDDELTSEIKEAQ
jgi:putative hemolysin